MVAIILPDFGRSKPLYLTICGTAVTTADGAERPSVRRANKVALTIREENLWELAVGPGHQWLSWFSVFGRRDPASGQPVSLWNRISGDIDRTEAEAWRAYDIHLLLRNRLGTLAPDIMGKIHIVGGSDDNYYLDGALEYLQEFLVDSGYGRREETASGRTVMLDGGGYVTILDGENHSSFVRDPSGLKLRRTFHAEMADRVR